MKIPLAFPVAMHDAELADFLNQWIHLIKGDPRLQQTYDYWVMGVGAEEKKPRWSILRDVIGWGIEKTESETSEDAVPGG